MAFHVITNKKIRVDEYSILQHQKCKAIFSLTTIHDSQFGCWFSFLSVFAVCCFFHRKIFFYIIKFNDIPCQFSTVSHCIVCCQKHFIGWSNEEIKKKTEQQKTREKKREKRTITTSWYNKLLILFTVQRCFYLSQLILCCSSWADVFVVVALKQTKIVIDKRRIFSTDSIWNRNSLGFKSKRKCKCTYFLTES